MEKSLTKKDIMLQARVLKNRGLVENTDFRIVYFSNNVELKVINNKSIFIR